MTLHKAQNMIGSAKSGRNWLELSLRESVKQTPASDIVHIMLAAARLARPFSAARLAAPARHISTSSPRRSDALFVVCPSRRL